MVTSNQNNQVPKKGRPQPKLKPTQSSLKFPQREAAQIITQLKEEDRTANTPQAKIKLLEKLMFIAANQKLVRVEKYFGSTKFGLTIQQIPANALNVSLQQNGAILKWQKDENSSLKAYNKKLIKEQETAYQREKEARTLATIKQWTDSDSTNEPTQVINKLTKDFIDQHLNELIERALKANYSGYPNLMDKIIAEIGRDEFITKIKEQENKIILALWFGDEELLNELAKTHPHLDRDIEWLFNQIPQQSGSPKAKQKQSAEQFERTERILQLAAILLKHNKEILHNDWVVTRAPRILALQKNSTAYKVALLIYKQTGNNQLIYPLKDNAGSAEEKLPEINEILRSLDSRLINPLTKEYPAGIPTQQNKQIEEHINQQPDNLSKLTQALHAIRAQNQQMPEPLQEIGFPINKTKILKVQISEGKLKPTWTDTEDDQTIQIIQILIHKLEEIEESQRTLIEREWLTLKNEFDQQEIQDHQKTAHLLIEEEILESAEQIGRFLIYPNQDAENDHLRAEQIKDNQRIILKQQNRLPLDENFRRSQINYDQQLSRKKIRKLKPQEHEAIIQQYLNNQTMRQQAYDTFINKFPYLKNRDKKQKFILLAALSQRLQKDENNPVKSIIFKLTINTADKVKVERNAAIKTMSGQGDTITNDEIQSLIQTILIRLLHGEQKELKIITNIINKLIQEDATSTFQSAYRSKQKRKEIDWLPYEEENKREDITKQEERERITVPLQIKESSLMTAEDHDANKIQQFKNFMETYPFIKGIRRPFKYKVARVMQAIRQFEKLKLVETHTLTQNVEAMNEIMVAQQDTNAIRVITKIREKKGLTDNEVLDIKNAIFDVNQKDKNQVPEIALKTQLEIETDIIEKGKALEYIIKHFSNHTDKELQTIDRILSVLDAQEQQQNVGEFASYVVDGLLETVLDIDGKSNWEWYINSWDEFVESFKKYINPTAREVSAETTVVSTNIFNYKFNKIEKVEIYYDTEHHDWVVIMKPAIPVASILQRRNPNSENSLAIVQPQLMVEDASPQIGNASTRNTTTRIKQRTN